MRDAALVAVYEAAVFGVEFPDGLRSFDASGQLSGGRVSEAFGGVTAWNPGWERLSPTENEAANVRLAEAIDALGWRRLPAAGHDRGGTYSEPSFAVFGATEGELVDLAREFRQAAIFWWDGERCRVVWC